jgi:hypothetical protein
MVLASFLAQMMWDCGLRLRNGLLRSLHGYRGCRTFSNRPFRPKKQVSDSWVRLSRRKMSCRQMLFRQIGLIP